MHKLTFTLKQHTPIIHFQHDQDGATLRATEVKPKLDRFILTQIGVGATNELKYKSGIDIAKSKKWLIGKGEHAALDYKMRINANQLQVEKYTIEKGRDHSFSPFFGNMGSEYEGNKKNLSLIKHVIANTIICNDNSLAREIINGLYDFFFTHNFGTRQGKGFGSFEVKSISLNGQNEKLINHFNFRYCFTIPITIDEQYWVSSFKELFSRIDFFYRTLRSGINIIGKDELYLKSSLFQYLYFQGIQWDKKTIKAHYFDELDISIRETKTFRNKKSGRYETKVETHDIMYLNTQNKQHKYPDILNDPEKQTDNFKLKDYRDILGLSSEESWYSYLADLSKKEAKYNGTRWEARPDKEGSVVRYQSPILFKPVETKENVVVYFDVFLNGKEQNDYYGKKFLIGLKHKKDSKNISYLPSLQSKNKSDLVLPIAGDLNIVEYLDWAFANISPKANVKPEYDELSRQAKEIIDDLESIYSELKTQQKND